MQRLDMRGLDCPVPTLKTVEAVKKARSAGDRVTVVLDDAVCAEEIPMQVGRWHYRAQVERTADSEWTIQLDPIDVPAARAAHSKEVTG